MIENKINELDKQINEVEDKLKKLETLVDGDFFLHHITKGYKDELMEEINTIKKDLEVLEKIKSHLKINVFDVIVYVPQYTENNGVVMYDDGDIKEWIKNEHNQE